MQQLGMSTSSASLADTNPLAAKAYLTIQTPESLDKARNLISLVDHDYSDKVVSTLLRLEVFAHEQAPVPGEYFEGERKFVAT